MTMKAKKILSLILAGAAAVSLLAGCGSDTENTQADTAQSDVQEDTAQDETQITGEDGSGTTASGNVLVVYYSATGNTEEVANTIAETTAVSHGNMRTRA